MDISTLRRTKKGFNDLSGEVLQERASPKCLNDVKRYINQVGDPLRASCGDVRRVQNTSL